MSHPLFDDVPLHQLEQASRDFNALAPGSTPEQLASGLKCLNLLYLSCFPRTPSEQVQADQAYHSAMAVATSTSQMG